MAETEYTTEIHKEMQGSTNVTSSHETTKQQLQDMDQRLKTLESLMKHLDVKNTHILETESHKNNAGFRYRVRRKPTKSSSFNSRSTSKGRRRSPYRHTVPSDKDETKRIEEFRKECMSKAIKCNYVDIVNSYTRKDDPIIFQPPTWLSHKEMTIMKKKPDVKYQCRTFLAILREKDFHTVRAWIQEESNLEEGVKNHVWKTFQEFNDTENIIRRLCIFCKPKMKVDCNDIIDHFNSIEIIDDDLYNEINSSFRKTGLQDEFWIKLAEQCTMYPEQSYIIGALTIALEEILKETEEPDTRNVIRGIIEELGKDCEQLGNIFRCNCKDICTKELQPLSLMESRSLAIVYTSPQNKRKVNVNDIRNDFKENVIHDSDMMQEDNSTSPVSSNESLASYSKMDTLKRFDNEIYQSNSNTVSMDERYLTTESSGRSWTNKRRNRNTANKKITDNNLAHGKTSVHDLGLKDVSDTEKMTKKRLTS